MKAMKLLKLKDVPCRSDDLGGWQESVLNYIQIPSVLRDFTH